MLVVPALAAPMTRKFGSTRFTSCERDAGSANPPAVEPVAGMDAKPDDVVAQLGAEVRLDRLRDHRGPAGVDPPARQPAHWSRCEFRERSRPRHAQRRLDARPPPPPVGGEAELLAPQGTARPLWVNSEEGEHARDRARPFIAKLLRGNHQDPPGGEAVEVLLELHGVAAGVQI